MTYVRARQYQQADQAYLDGAEKARSMEQWVWEARAYRIMAMYATDPAAVARFGREIAFLTEQLQEKEAIVARGDRSPGEGYIGFTPYSGD